MEFCPIVPTSLLEEYATRSKWQMCLAPMCLKEPKYFDFYLKRRQAGDKVILDNGVYENAVVPWEEYQKLLIALAPTEFVVPDEKQNPEETSRMNREFPKIVGIKRAYVIQGDHAAIPLDSDILCFPKWMGVRRLEVIKTFVTPITPRPFHALGFIDDDPLAELPLLAKAGVRSIDSSEPVWKGLFNRKVGVDTVLKFKKEWNTQWETNPAASSNLSEVFQLCQAKEFRGRIVSNLRDHSSESMVEFSRTTGSKKPQFGLIPYNALVALANRYELGEKKHAAKAWNALSKNQEGLKDSEWMRARVEHIIHHAYQFLLKYNGLIPDDGDDDAAAIMWGGSCLSEGRRVKNDNK